jgi:hypothetical protein
LKQEGKFPGMALIILLLLVAINLILMIPVTAKIMEITMSSTSIPEEQKNIALQVMHNMRYLQALGGVFMTAVTLFLYALVMFVITAITKPVLGYIKSLTVIIYSYFSVVIGELINTALLYFKGWEEIQSPYEISVTGANLFTSVDKVGAPLYMFLSLVNPFQLWFIILLSIGIKVFTDMKYTKALIICIIFWLITVIFPVASAWFGEMAMQRAGVM